MNAPRQIRISVNGVFQFTVKVDQDESLESVAQRAAESMQLSDQLRPLIQPGLIDFRAFFSWRNSDAS